MTSRERVLSAVNHREPDRLPVFRPNIIPTYEPFEPRVQRFMDTFGFDRLAGLGGIVNGPSAARERADGTTEDAYECRFRYMGVGGPYCIYHPLANAQTVGDIDRFGWPNVDRDDLIAPEARENAAKTREQGDCATALGIDTLFHRYHYLRGFDRWMMDLRLEPAIHKAIADHVHHINSTMAMHLLEAVGEYTDIVTTGDDFGHSTAPYMSPEDFRAHIKPYYQDLFGRIKRRFPHIRIYLHSHGQIMDLVPDLIECGIDILNPILPLDNMDPVRLKREFGDRLSFEGGIDIEHVLLFGTVHDVEAHVKHVIDILAPGGGYLFKAQAVSRLIPYDNLITAYDVALSHWRPAS